jgi:hypothetical protein
MRVFMAKTETKSTSSGSLVFRDQLLDPIYIDVSDEKKTK